MDRRRFLKTGAFSLGTLSLNSFPHHLLASQTKKFASDQVHLGLTGIKVSRLAMGTGTNGVRGSSNQTRKMGIGGISDLFKQAYDEGVNFWDSADQYGSHPHLKAALQSVPREKVVILTKTHASTRQEMKADLDRFRREIGTDYIDIVLLHCMMDVDWPRRKQGAMEVLSEAREEGLIRAHGVSCHTLEALETAAAEPWVQVDLARVNPAGVAMDAEVPRVLSVLRTMKARGKAVIGMKILGAGKLTHRADECLQFALALDCVDCFTIGSESHSDFQGLLQKIPVASVRA